MPEYRLDVDYGKHFGLGGYSTTLGEIPRRFLCCAYDEMDYATLFATAARELRLKLRCDLDGQHDICVPAHSCIVIQGGVCIGLQAPVDHADFFVFLVRRELGGKCPDDVHAGADCCGHVKMTRFGLV